VATKREIRLAAKALGILPEHRRRRPRRPVVVRQFVPDERAQVAAIASLLRDAINTLPTEPIEKRDRTANGPEDADERRAHHVTRTGTILP
jgi:hypothetical protein